MEIKCPNCHEIFRPDHYDEEYLYLTNSSIVYDCIKESHRLLTNLKKEITTLDFENYRTEGKKTHTKINFAKNGDKRVDLFRKQLELFVKSINQVSNVVKKS